MIPSERLRALFALNPVVGFVEGFRWSVLGRSALTPTMFWITVGVSVFLLLSGAFFFRRTERQFADII
jgi:lipopolysaccharide transport system permease protein